MLLDHCFTLWGGQSCEGEHTNLSGDVVPGSLGSILLEIAPQQYSHVGDTVSHINQLFQPLVSHLSIVQNEGCDSSSVLWWGRVGSSNDDFHLGENLSCNLLVSADKVESSTSFTIETHDLSERLSDAHLETLVKEISESFSILIQVSSDESLIGSVKEWVESSFLAYLSNDLPLVHGWVDTGWVVSTSVEQNCGSISGILEIFNHTLEIKSLSFLVEVSVGADVNSASSEDLVMVTPCWRADVN